MEFPKFKYSVDGQAVIVKDADDEKALGRGWQDMPLKHEPGPGDQSLGKAKPLPVKMPEAPKKGEG